MVEGLSGLVRQAVRTNMLEGVKLGNLEVEACILQFIDDTFFMCKANHQSVFRIKVILRCYDLALRLKINFHK